MLASAVALQIKLWQRDGTSLRTLKDHTDEVWGVTLLRWSGTSASDDKTIKLSGMELC